eukprot:Skav211884  [mRNA]  locus=scaffold3296:9217:10851:+ [translate_table: standard]
MVSCCRVGEASNPGPASQDMVIGTVNTNGLLGKSHLIQELPRGTWGLTETHLTVEGRRRFQVELKAVRPDFRFVGGHPAPYLSKSPGAIGGKATGVGVLTASPARGMVGDWPEPLWQTGRVQTCAILAGTQWLKMAVIYGYATDPKTISTKESTSALLDPAVQRLVHHTPGYRIICGDMNQTTDALDVFDHLRQWGWVELQEYAWHKWGREIVPTSRDATVIDHMWISPELVPKLRSVSTDTTMFRDHAVLFGTFDPLGSYEPVPVWPVPKPLPWSEIDDNNQLPVEPLSQVTTIQGILQATEEWVDHQMRSQNSQGLLPQQYGRCKAVAPVMTRFPVTPPKRSRTHDVQVDYCGEHWQHTKWLRQLRRLQSLCRVLASQSTPQHMRHAHDLWRSILQATGFPQGFRKAWQSRSCVLPGSPVHLPRQPPDHATACIIFESFHLDFKALEKSLHAARRSQAKERRDKDGNIIYRDLRDDRALPVQTLVSKVQTTITAITNHNTTIHYEPTNLATDQPVSSLQGYLPIAEHHVGQIDVCHPVDFEV